MFLRNSLPLFGGAVVLNSVLNFNRFCDMLSVLWIYVKHKTKGQKGWSGTKIAHFMNVCQLKDMALICKWCEILVLGVFRNNIEQHFTWFNFNWCISSEMSDSMDRKQGLI